MAADMEQRQVDAVTGTAQRRSRSYYSPQPFIGDTIKAILRGRQTEVVPSTETMNLDDILSDLSREFLLVKMKRELDTVDDPEALRKMVLVLVNLVEDQKTIFKQLLDSLFDGEEEAQDLFE